MLPSASKINCWQNNCTNSNEAKKFIIRCGFKKYNNNITIVLSTESSIMDDRHSYHIDYTYGKLVIAIW